MDIQMMIVVAFRYLVFCHKLWQITTFDMSLFLLSWQIFRYNTRPAFIPESTVVGYWLGFVQWMMSNDDVGGEFRMVAVDLVACILLLSAAAGWLLYDIEPLILVVVVIVVFIVYELLSDSCLLLGVYRPWVVRWMGGMILPPFSPHQRQQYCRRGGFPYSILLWLLLLRRRWHHMNGGAANGMSCTTRRMNFVDCSMLH